MGERRERKEEIDNRVGRGEGRRERGERGKRVERNRQIERQRDR